MNNKQELIHSLKESILHNENAIDYIDNLIHKVEDELAYLENDITLTNELNNLKYIKFILDYIGLQYESSLQAQCCRGNIHNALEFGTCGVEVQC